MKNISRERIFVEFKKLLNGIKPSEILLKYKSVISEFIPELSEASEDNYIFVCQRIDVLEKDVDLRLSVFLSVFSADTAVSVLRNLKADNRTVRFVKNTILGLEKELKADKVSVKYFLKENSPTTLEAVLKINNNPAISEIFTEVIEKNECYSIEQLDINGRDIVNLGLTGEKAGIALEYLLEKVIKNEVENTKKSLTGLIKNTLL